MPEEGYYVKFVKVYLFYKMERKKRQMREKIIILRENPEKTEIVFSCLSGRVQLIEAFGPEEVLELVKSYGSEISMILVCGSCRDAFCGDFLKRLYLEGYPKENPILGMDAEDSKLIQVLKNEADTDPLTGLYNKRAFQRQVEEWLESGERMGAFGIIDIDNFKVLNDKYGHRFGDEILFWLAEKLRENLNGSIVVGRFGGDEFVLFWKEIGMKEEIRTEAERICKVLREEAMGVKMTGSLGIACYPRDGESYEELLCKADKALYLAKDRGKDGYVIYS